MEFDFFVASDCYYLTSVMVWRSLSREPDQSGMHISLAGTRTNTPKKCKPNWLWELLCTCNYDCDIYEPRHNIDVIVRILWESETERKREKDDENIEVKLVTAILHSTLSISPSPRLAKCSFCELEVLSCIYIMGISKERATCIHAYILLSWSYSCSYYSVPT